MCMRRLSALAALLLALAPATSWAAFARVELVPSAPAPVAPSFSAGAAAAASVAPSLTAALPPAPALAPSISAAPAAAPRLQAAAELAAVPQAAMPAVAAIPAAAAGPARDGAPEATASPRALALPAADAGRLFDGAPSAPDFDALSPVRAPRAPAAWTPASSLLKPVAAVFNAAAAARHRRRLLNARPDERVTTEEHSLRETLTFAHSALEAGRYQDAISAVTEFFHTRAAASWYAENPGYASYRAQAFAYMRFAERAVLAAYGRAFRRSNDAALIAEAREAASEGAILGHAWRPTAIQEKDSSYCVQNALFNAIAASVGFARPTRIEDFVAASRAALNRAPRLDRPAGAAEISELSRELGLDFGRVDVTAGMGTRSLAEWARSLGMELAPQPGPRGDAGWSGLFAPGREILLSLRMFHPRYRNSEELRTLRGHDFMILHHEVYLLGAFDSPSRGTRLYLLQDSGSGRTLMATAEELDALTLEVQLLSVSAPVAVPRTR